MSATDEDSCSSQQQLQEENFILRTQVAKLQVALRSALTRHKDEVLPTTTSAEEFVSKQQLEVIMGELADLRRQVNHLHEENRSLQAQLQQVREVQAASGSSSGAAGDPWEPVPAASPDVDPVSRHDMAFIEREISCLKQKISETRLKLQSAEPITPVEYSPAPIVERRAAQRQPLQRKQALAGRPGAGPAPAPRHHGR